MRTWLSKTKGWVSEKPSDAAILWKQTIIDSYRESIYKGKPYRYPLDRHYEYHYFFVDDKVKVTYQKLLPNGCWRYSDAITTTGIVKLTPYFTIICENGEKVLMENYTFDILTINKIPPMS